MAKFSWAWSVYCACRSQATNISVVSAFSSVYCRRLPSVSFAQALDLLSRFSICEASRPGVFKPAGPEEDVCKTKALLKSPSSRGAHVLEWFVFTVVKESGRRLVKWKASRCSRFLYRILAAFGLGHGVCFCLFLGRNVCEANGSDVSRRRKYRKRRLPKSRCGCAGWGGPCGRQRAGRHPGPPRR